jgi:hypothetical protein
MNPARFAFHSTSTLLVAMAFLTTGGCYVRTTARTTQPSVTVQTQQQQQPTQSGVVVLESSCVQGAQEICNGLDDNCNGQIDEGCGYSSGDVQITLAWNTGADLDLYVYDPQGNRIYYGEPQAPSGGHLDQDARGNCNPSQPNNRIENVYWGGGVRPPSGRYTVEVHYWAGDGCSSNAGPTTGVVSISVGGSILGTYQLMLAGDQRATFATFDIP